MNNFLKYGVFAALCLAGLLRLDTAGAQGLYQTELSTRFSLSDGEGNNETKVYALSGRYYFSPVDPAGHPLKEAAFLERVGRFEFVFAMSDLRFVSSRTTGGPFYGGSVFYMQPGFPLLLSTGFTQPDLEFDPPQASDLSVYTYDLSFAIFSAPVLWWASAAPTPKRNSRNPACPIGWTRESGGRGRQLYSFHKMASSHRQGNRAEY